MALSVNSTEHLFEQKYRPQSISECILPAADKQMFEGIIASGNIPSMILVSRSPGTGKTTVARALCNDMDAEVFFMNGSDAKLDVVRNELTQFASCMSREGKKKVIILDEMDRRALKDSQLHLRSFIEAFSSNCSVIMTANNEDGIIDALKSRCQVVRFGNPTDADKLNMMKAAIIRCNAICKNEGITVEDPRVLAALVKQNFPDIRKITNTMDRYSRGSKTIDSGILSVITGGTGIGEVIDALKAKNFKDIRKLSGRYVHDYPSFITKLYEELYKHANPASIPSVITTIGQNQMYWEQVANLEIHIDLLLCTLMIETNWK